MKVVLATKNPGKLKELQELASETPEIEFALAPPSFDADETGKTFLENAIIKAQEAARLTGCYALADDSGITVEYLDGAPGIHSARYCEGSDTDRRRKLMREVGNAEDRRAAFICAMALSSPQGEILHSSLGRWFGEIGFDERGQNGFGYDPIFWLPEMQKTAAELSSEMKNRISHRAQAWRQMASFLVDIKSDWDNR